MRGLLIPMRRESDRMTHFVWLFVSQGRKYEMLEHPREKL